MSWESVIRFYRFVLRSGDAHLGDLLTRALAADPRLRRRADAELRALTRISSRAPDWVIRALVSGIRPSTARGTR